MDLARVIGVVVARRKDPALEGVQLCVIEPVDEKLAPAAPPLLATEAATPRAVGDLVYYVASGDAVYTHPDGRALPTDAAIVGMADRVDLAPIDRNRTRRE
jgi:microcompartment protein CcmK/EutM